MIKSIKHLTKISCLSTFLILVSTLVSAAEDKKLSFSTTEVAPGLYMLMGVGGFTGGNIGKVIVDLGAPS